MKRLRRSYLCYLRDEGRCGAVTRTATKLLEIEPGEIERARPVLPVHLEHEHRVLVPEVAAIRFGSIPARIHRTAKLCRASWSV